MKRIIEIDLVEMYDTIFSIIDCGESYKPFQEYEWFILEQLNIIDEEESKFLFDMYLDLPMDIKITNNEFNLKCDGNNIELEFKNLVEKMNPELENFYRLMPYNMFLHSGYWKIVSRYKKYISDNKCIMCCSPKNLNTHHNNYENRGMEYKNLNDLVVVCGKCHSTHHHKG